MGFDTTTQEGPRRGFHPSPAAPERPRAWPEDPGSCPYGGARAWRRNGTYPRHLIVPGALDIQRWPCQACLAPAPRRDLPPASADLP